LKIRALGLMKNKERRERERERRERGEFRPRGEDLMKNNVLML
jgi:hypothetical protein